MAQDLQPGTLRMGQSATRPGTLVLSWQGPIAAPMANQIRDAFESQKRQSSSISFRISSQGGSVSEGERVIEVLRKIRETHELETTVSHGDVCASMCVFIYLQGKKRSGALTSSWLFHEVSHIGPRDQADDPHRSRRLGAPGRQVFPACRRVGALDCRSEAAHRAIRLLADRRVI